MILMMAGVGLIFGTVVWWATASASADGWEFDADFSYEEPARLSFNKVAGFICLVAGVGLILLGSR